MPEVAELTANYYRAWFRYHPEVAVECGVDDYAHLLTPFGDDDIGALKSLNEKLLASLDEIDEAALVEADRLDCWLLRGAALLELEELAEWDWRQREPARFLPVHAIYQLTLRKVADPGHALRSRLASIPGHLREARAFLREAPAQIPARWLASAIEEAHQGAIYLRGLRQHPDVEPYRLDRELDAAAHALEDFARFLERELAPLASGSPACGRDYFELLLRHRHGLDVDADALHRYGQTLFDATQAALQEETRRLGGNDINTVTQQIQASRPAASELLGVYRETMQAARTFVARQRLVSLPRVEKLKVVETPIFLRHQIPFAAYVEPAPNDPQQQGWYYVTPPADEAALGEHNHVAIKITCVHEAWPGHHLQFVRANSQPLSSTLPRLTNPSATLYEGWALYCEQLMLEAGFLEEDAARFLILRDRLWRALRILLDVELHTRDLSVEDAAVRMQAALGFSQEQALAEVDWYTRSPTVPMGYATGWALINATRERLQGMDDAFELRAFHDALLADGSIALPWVLRNRFGQPLWESVRQSVFGQAG